MSELQRPASAETLGQTWGSGTVQPEDALLRACQERLAIATSAIRGIVYDWDFIRGTVARSSGLSEILGYRLEEIAPVATWWSERIHPDDVACVPSYSEPWPRPEVMSVEYRMRHKDGSWVWVWDHNRALFAEDGKVTRIVGFSMIIDERKRAEEALRESEVRFRAMADTVPDILFASSTDGRCHYTNQRFYEYTGMPAGAGEGYGWVEALHPDDREPTRQRWVQCVQTGGPLGTEYRLRGKDGVYRWFFARARPIVGPDGKIEKMFGAAADIHDLKMAQEALRVSEEHLRLATEAGEIGTLYFDTRSGASVISETTRRVIGWPPGEAPSMQQWLSLVHPDDRGAVAERARASFASGSAQRYQYRIVRPDGELRWIETTVRVYMGDDGLPTTLYGAMHDVTERMRLEKERDALLDSERAARCEAERANRLKDDFLAVMSHELRTPLNAILGFSQMLRRGIIPADRQNSALESIERNATLLSRLIADVLDVGRIRAGKMKLDLEETDFATVIDTALDTQRMAAASRQVTLERSGEASGVRVLGDEGRLQQIVWNLLTNAVKFSNPGGRVEVSLRRQGHSAVLEVRDEGQGIRPELVPQLFEPFRQADVSAARRHGGLGLGLSIVKQIAELHGGSATAESAGEGKGATFTVALPLANAHSATSGEAGDTGPASGITEKGTALRALEGLKVLVVDDEPDALELTRRLLEEEGVDARTVSSAADALETVRTGWPEVLVSDLGMPGEDGFHLVRTIRSDERTRVLPVVALTAFARDEDRARAESAGFDAHVAKPVDPRRLFEALGRVSKRYAS